MSHSSPVVGIGNASVSTSRTLRPSSFPPAASTRARMGAKEPPWWPKARQRVGRGSGRPNADSQSARLGTFFRITHELFERGPRHLSLKE